MPPAVIQTKDDGALDQDSNRGSGESWLGSELADKLIQV